MIGFQSQRSNASPKHTLNNLVGNSGDSRDIEELSKILKDDYVRARINQRDVNGEIALIAACKNRNEKAVELLLKHGAKPGVSNKCGESPFSVLKDSQSDVVERIERMLDSSLVSSKFQCK